MRRIFPAAPIVALVLAACFGPVSYPDTPAVTAAQAAWCDGFAKAGTNGASEEQTAACKAATPTASPGYLRAVTRCFVARRAELGDKPYDSGQIVAECNDEAMMKMKIDDGAAKEALTAHCERALRCEKVSPADCRKAIEKLETSQRALLYSRYNGAALHAVADCLRGASCGDEDAAHDACYKLVADKLVWLP